MADRPSLVELVIDVNDRFTVAAVPHGFGGAIALAYYVAEPRATRDMDINVFVPVGSAESVFKLLPDGVDWDQGSVRRCRRDGQVRLWFGDPRDGIPIDLFFPQHQFHARVQEATSARPFARRDYLIPVIAAAHLVVFKVLFNRPKDWVDVTLMLSAGSVDIAESLHWLMILLGEDHPSYRRLVEAVADTPSLTARLEGPSAVDWGTVEEEDR